MAVNNSWRQPVTMSDWMRDIEKRLMHEERRPTHAAAVDVVGPGISTYSRLVEDWNSEGPAVDGFFYSDAGQVVNSPDDTRDWMGLVQANSIGQGLQRVWEYIQSPTDPAPDPALYTRAFVTNEDGTRSYSPWLQGGGGGGSGIDGIIIQDEGTTVGTVPQLDFIGAGVSALMGTGEVQLTIDGTPHGPASGDLTGNYPNPTIAPGAIPDEVWIGTSQPTDPDLELWYDPDATAPGTTVTLGYTFVQGTSASVWTINHPLTFQPNVAVVDSSGRQIEGDVTYTDADTVTVTFSAPFAGTAYLS